MPSPSADATAATPPAIHAVDLAKSYGRIEALTGLTLSVARGEVFGFLGPNGAGKTTAVKLLLGLASPTAGDAWLLGEPIGHPQARRRVGYLPELFRFPAWLTPAEVVRFHCALIDVPREEREAEVMTTLTTVGLHDRANDRVGTFSKGMQQRLGLAVAMIGDPLVVFLDEPTSALDPVGRHDVREIIRRLRDHGTTVFLNSHLLSEVELVCDRVAVVDHGHVIASGSLDDIQGGGVAVRIHVTAADDATAALSRWGEASTEGDWVTVRGVDSEAIADMVAELVRRGARVHAVEPQRESLEERFLELLRAEDGDAAR